MSAFNTLYFTLPKMDPYSLIFSTVIIWNFMCCRSTVDDMRVGIQTCDGGSACSSTGSERYSPYAKDGGGWTAWAGDEDYYDPDGVRIGLFGRDHPSYSNEYIEDIDIRLCVQITDWATDSSGNSDNEGNIQCTPWVTDGGGWSSYATSRYGGDWDAWRVQLDTQSSPGLLINMVRSGVQLTDGGTNTAYQGTAEYTDYLQAAITSTWCEYASDNDGYNPDAVRIYISATSWTRSPTREPTPSPSPAPTNHPSFSPTAHPSTSPSVHPTLAPTESPSIAPTAYPTFDPTNDPTADPSVDPTFDPTIDPTYDPTYDPTSDPTTNPTAFPTSEPTTNPTMEPTIPTIDPTVDPTLEPTLEPTTYPTIYPTVLPTSSTESPTARPTISPTNAPTEAPFESERADAPTSSPSILFVPQSQSDAAANQESGTNGLNDVLVLVAIICGGPFILTLIILIVYCIHSRKKRGTDTNGGIMVNMTTSIAMTGLFEHRSSLPALPSSSEQLISMEGQAATGVVPVEGGGTGGAVGTGSNIDFDDSDDDTAVLPGAATAVPSIEPDESGDELYHVMSPGNEMKEEISTDDDEQDEMYIKQMSTAGAQPSSGGVLS